PLDAPPVPVNPSVTVQWRSARLSACISTIQPTRLGGVPRSRIAAGCNPPLTASTQSICRRRARANNRAILQNNIAWAAQTQVARWMDVIAGWKQMLGADWDKTYAASNTIYVTRQNNVLFS